MRSDLKIEVGPLNSCALSSEHHGTRAGDLGGNTYEAIVANSDRTVHVELWNGARLGRTFLAENLTTALQKAQRPQANATCPQ